ncbi:hypothetical protein AF80_00075 [Aliarcobacter butzleri L355]|uniref:Glycosyl transferase family 1 domain-containing protein n=1 Tax=Aliarcobacter butzleri L355 TaxID=1447263 RepID=A0A0G9KYS8_9BACT|nr:glycosyltransferase [Aliarcobacter butzleri]KLE11779.1 hypothetical protein AF80_00075 [Aliarcobacter butzleri L355]
MKRIHIYFNYKHTDKPWGGANNFNRLLHKKLSENDDFVLEEKISKSTDIIFMNGTSNGASIDKNQGTVTYRQFKKFKASGAKVVIRSINLKQHAHGHHPLSAWKDYWTIKMLNEADFVIFQSDYQRNFFLGAGFDNMNNTVIHNGANGELFCFNNRTNSLNKKIKLISTVAGARPTKNLKLLSDVSLIDDIEIYHVGDWNQSLDPKNIKLLGKKTHEEMTEIYKSMDSFIHLAIKDPCPNAIFEAILSGLPVVYYPNQTSSSEIVKDNGTPLVLNDYKKTFGNLRELYPKIVQSIEQTRYYYSIDRAVEDYIVNLKKVCQ